jgi:hypothetical protein
MPATLARLITVGEIVRQTGEDRHRIEYILRTRDIRPRGMAGNARVFDEDAVNLITTELQRIDAARDMGGAR